MDATTAVDELTTAIGVSDGDKTESGETEVKVGVTGGAVSESEPGSDHAKTALITTARISANLM